MEKIQPEVIGSNRVTGRPSVMQELGRPESIGQMMRVDVIVLEDAHTGERYSTLWGRKILEEIISSGRGKEVRLLSIPILPETDELEIALAACTVAKGSHEYAGEGVDA